MANNNNNNNNNNNKLQFGCYNVNVRKNDGSTETVLCKPLTQSEYAEGWQSVLPRRTKKSNVYNWNLTLSQLPPHLWSRCHLHLDDDSKEYYNRINDGIYRYNVSTTDYDDEMHELYKQLHYTNPNLTRVRELVEELKYNVSGWLLIRANTIL